MSKVWAKVKVTNPFDEAQVRRNLLSENLIRQCKIDAIVDVTTFSSILPLRIIEKLGLRIIGKETENQLKFEVAETAAFEIFGRRSVEEAFVFGEKVIIGRNVLARMDLLVDCKEQKLVPKHGDKPVFRI